MGIIRAESIARMRKAFRGGISFSTFFKAEKSAGRGTYRRTDMLADFRSINELETKKGLVRYVRRDRLPTEKTIATVTWAIDKEYMYQVKVLSVLKPGEPVTERFVNILSDVPLTPAQIESQVREDWKKWERYSAEEITGLQVWSAVRKVME